MDKESTGVVVFIVIGFLLGLLIWEVVGNSRESSHCEMITNNSKIEYDKCFGDFWEYIKPANKAQ